MNKSGRFAFFEGYSAAGGSSGSVLNNIFLTTASATKARQYLWSAGLNFPKDTNFFVKGDLVENSIETNRNTLSQLGYTQAKIVAPKLIDVSTPISNLDQMALALSHLKPDSNSQLPVGAVVQRRTGLREVSRDFFGNSVDPARLRIGIED